MTGGELFIANMDRDDAKDDLLRLYIIYTPLPQDDQGYDGETAELSWYRSKNGVDRWRLFKQYSFSYHFKHGETTAARFGFAGRFGTLSGGTLVLIKTESDISIAQEALLKSCQRIR